MATPTNSTAEFSLERMARKRVEDETWGGGWEAEGLSRASRRSANVRPNIHSPGFQQGTEKTAFLLREDEKKTFLFFYRFFEVFLLVPGICLLFISPLEAHQFFVARSEAEIPPRGGLKMPANKLFVVFGFWKKKRTTSFVLLLKMWCFLVY